MFQYLMWDDSYSSGIEKFDEDHKKEFDLINRVGATVCGCPSIRAGTGACPYKRGCLYLRQLVVTRYKRATCKRVVPGAGIEPARSLPTEGF